MQYRVIVGNVGTVYSGGDEAKAKSTFKEYREQSRTGYGRASYEEVTMQRYGGGMFDWTTMEEFRPQLLVPTIKELASLIRAIKSDGIGDDYRAYEDDEKPGILLTIGCSYDKGWSYQTGDNSYTGGAYGHPYWGVGAIYRNSNSYELAREIINDVHEQTC